MEQQNITPERAVSSEEAVPKVMKSASFFAWLMKSGTKMEGAGFDAMVDQYVSKNHIICMDEEKKAMGERLRKYYPEAPKTMPEVLESAAFLVWQMKKGGARMADPNDLKNAVESYFSENHVIHHPDDSKKIYDEVREYYFEDQGSFTKTG